MAQDTFGHPVRVVIPRLLLWLWEWGREDGHHLPLSHLGTDLLRLLFFLTVLIVVVLLDHDIEVVVIEIDLGYLDISHRWDKFGIV